MKTVQAKTMLFVRSIAPVLGLSLLLLVLVPGPVFAIHVDGHPVMRPLIDLEPDPLLLEESGKDVTVRFTFANEFMANYIYVNNCLELKLTPAGFDGGSPRASPVSCDKSAKKAVDGVTVKLKYDRLDVIDMVPDGTRRISFVVISPEVSSYPDTISTVEPHD